MTTYEFSVNGVIVKYTHANIGQAWREARADNPGATIEAVKREKD